MQPPKHGNKHIITKSWKPLCSTPYSDGAVIGLGGAMAPPNFFYYKNVTILIGINFSNFVQ